MALKSQSKARRRRVFPSSLEIVTVTRPMSSLVNRSWSFFRSRTLSRSHLQAIATIGSLASRKVAIQKLVSKRRREKYDRRRRSSTSANESFLDTSQHTITPSKGGARFGHASWPDSRRALRTAVSTSRTLRTASAPC